MCVQQYLVGFPMSAMHRGGGGGGVFTAIFVRIFCVSVIVPIDIFDGISSSLLLRHRSFLRILCQSVSLLITAVVFSKLCMFFCCYCCWWCWCLCYLHSVSL